MFEYLIPIDRVIILITNRTFIYTKCPHLAGLTTSISSLIQHPILRKPVPRDHYLIKNTISVLTSHNSIILEKDENISCLVALFSFSEHSRYSRSTLRIVSDMTLIII